MTDRKGRKGRQREAGTHGRSLTLVKSPSVALCPPCDHVPTCRHVQQLHASLIEELNRGLLQARHWHPCASPCTSGPV